MADKSFGVKELNLLNASGTPTVTSPNNLNLNANTVAISTSCTIGNNLTVTSTTNSANLNVTGIGTLTRAFATDLSVSGVTTITVPANANPHSSWDVVNNSASAYRFTGPGQDGAEDNPNIYLVRGQRYVFKMNASGHPFQIRVANAGAAYSDGVTNNGSQTGNVVFNVQHDAPAQLFYQCTSHGSMVGNIYIVGGPQVISGVVTATTFVGNLTGNPTGSGANLTSLPAANLTGTLPAISGANLTNLPAANLTGTLPAISGANLTSLPAQATISNNADNRVITGGSGVNLNGESGLTYNGTAFRVDSTTSENNAFRVYNTTTSATTFQINGEGNSFQGHTYPRTDSNLDLGYHATNKWRDVVLSGGIRFGSGNEVDYLDDYNEGTFQPYYDSTNSNLTFHGGSATNNSYYTSRSGSYVKIGKRVFFQISVATNGLTVVGGSGQMRISGLPFTAAPSAFGVGSSTYPRAVISCMGGRFNSFTPSYLVVNAASTNLQVRESFETYGQAVGGTGGFDTSGSSNRNVIEAFGYYDVSN